MSSPVPLGITDFLGAGGPRHHVRTRWQCCTSKNWQQGRQDHNRPARIPVLCRLQSVRLDCTARKTYGSRKPRERSQIDDVGASTEYALPARRVSPKAYGRPDGNLCSSRNANKIGNDLHLRTSRILHPTGTVDATSRSAMHYGSPSHAGKIGKVTTANVHAVYPSPKTASRWAGGNLVQRIGGMKGMTKRAIIDPDAGFPARRQRHNACPYTVASHTPVDRMVYDNFGQFDSRPAPANGIPQGDNLIVHGTPKDRPIGWVSDPGSPTVTVRAFGRRRPGQVS